MCGSNDEERMEPNVLFSAVPSVSCSVRRPRTPSSPHSTISGMPLLRWKFFTTFSDTVKGRIRTAFPHASTASMIDRGTSPCEWPPLHPA
jgi:hypothetical protein